MSNELAYRLTAISITLLLASGCTSQHYSAAILLSKDHNTANTYRAIDSDTGKFEGNVVDIGANSRFSVEIRQILPGWLHRQNVVTAAAGAKKNVKNNHFMDKELWLLTTIQSKSPNDVMELQSKRYFKASNVKFESSAFAIMKLDQAERIVFTHLADTAYTVKFEIFEIDGFRVKQELTAASQNPGISGIVVDVAKTGVNILGATVGDYVTTRVKKVVDEPLAVERLLLKQGAVREFSGTFTINRRMRAENPEIEKPVTIRDFYLLDYYKSKVVSSDNKGKQLDDRLPKEGDMRDRNKHATASKELFTAACIGDGVYELMKDEVSTEKRCFDKSSQQVSYIKFSVSEAPKNLDLDTDVLVKQALDQSILELKEEINQEVKMINENLKNTEFTSFITRKSVV